MEARIFSFLSIKAAALIPQVAMSSSGVPLNPIAQRYAHAMLVQCCQHTTCMLHMLLRAFPPDDPTVGQLLGKCCSREWMTSPYRAHCHTWTV
jgi:hypothetical protein